MTGSNIRRLCIALAIVGVCGQCRLIDAADTNPIDRPTLTLDGDAATLVMDLAGGCIASFQLNQNPLNPLNIWRSTLDGRPWARGLEFGTTGLHELFPALVEQNRILDRPVFAYLDAGQTVTRSYCGFLLPVADDFAGVAQRTYRRGEIRLVERAMSPRILTLRAGDLLDR